MKFYDTLNKYLDRLAFSNKTKLLVAITSISMMTIGFLMMISIFALKFDYETLYEKRTLPQVELEEIKDIYTVNIYDTLYDIKENNIDVNNAAEVLSLAIQIVKVQWKNYNDAATLEIGGLPEFASNWLNFFLLAKVIPNNNYYQNGIVLKIKEKIKSIDQKIEKIIFNIEKKDTSINHKNINDIFLEINSINIYLASLITSHLKKAVAEKNRTDRVFKTSIYMLVFLIGLVFFLSILITLVIINNFQNLNNSLETKIANKTKELRALNNSLEKKVKAEVENNRKKDQIMFQQARLASLGEMLQNIAHQWRQPLGALTMIIQSFQSKFLCGKLDEKFIDSRVEDAGVLAKNMSDTLEDFRTFFDPNKSHKTFSLKNVIDKSLDLTKYELEKEGILVNFIMPQDIKIYGFENELTHVILNLIHNSKDALCENKIEDKRLRILVKQTDKNVLINVIDNAGGIKTDIMGKVFDPYFTTKHKSVGTGIGLYMSKQMVEKHMNGEISCKNILHKMGTLNFNNCAMFTIEIAKQMQDEKDMKNEEA